MLDGTISQLGPSYVISARLVAAADGRELAVFRRTADSDAELVAALGKLSHDFDVTADARRERVANALLDHGERVQYSVFECWLDVRELAS